MQKRLAKLGYVEVENASAESWRLVRGHEFRYSIMDPMPESVTRVYREPAEGYRIGSVMGSYIHLHFLSCPHFAEQFVQDCASQRTLKQK
jgi:cobyrinic acid a,c-diamide synthase